MAANPEESLPVQNQSWADLKAAYRFFDNPHVTPDALQAQHRRLTVQAANGHPVILCVQDSSNIAAARVPGGEWVMHSALAVTPGGEVLGLLDQHFFQRVKAPAKESRRAARARFRESDVWLDTLTRIGPLGSRVVHVCDRGGDDLRLMLGCCRQGSGFVIRARHDRNVQQATDKLWSHMEQIPSSGEIEIQVGEQRCVKRRSKGKTSRSRRPARTTRLEVHFANVQLQSPPKAGYDQKHLSVNVVYLKEPGDDPNTVQWMLLTNLPVTNLPEALQVVDYYRKRWVIEEWHRAMKEGCALNDSQLQHIENLLRLISVLAVIATRLLQLRHWADTPSMEPTKAQLDLQEKVPRSLMRVVSALSKTPRESITPRLLWQTLARHGGWLGRKHDPRPGWKAIWTGWRLLSHIALGLELAEESQQLQS